MQKKDKIDNNDRNDKACDAELKIDYGEGVFQSKRESQNQQLGCMPGKRIIVCPPSLVYKMTMESYEDHFSIDVYKMRINQVIKEGKPLSALNFNGQNISIVYEIHNIYIGS